MKKKQTTTKQIERFSPSINEGLSPLQIEQRISDGLVNNVKKSYSKSYLKILQNNFCTFFNLLGLLVAIALTIAKQPISSYFFVVIYIANIGIGIIQEIRAKKCIDKLSLVAEKKIKVVRDGEIVEILSTQIVLDDIIKLGIGNQVPTDCIIQEGNIEVNEALLTGESVPVKKTVGDTILAGSFIVAGVCTAKADKIGEDNYVETLSAKAKQYKKPNSELMTSLRVIIKTISFLIVPVGLAYVIKGALAKETFADIVGGSSTVIIGMIPSGMFLLTSLALAVGIIKLARHKTLVQDLYSLEMLARVDTICFDKTGTITDGKMTVRETIILDDNLNLGVETIVGSMLNSLKDNNQTALALLDRFGENDVLTPITSMPFNSARKLSAVTFENEGTFCYGAPEFVLSKDEYAKLKDSIEGYAHKGLRVLVLAKSKQAICDDKLPNDFTPVALILIVDNIREDAIDTINWFKQNDVQIKVISGDNPITVAEVSKRVGIENADKYISLDGLTDKEVIAVANKYTVFGRVSPEQKALLIKSMRAEGHVTAMTGDGVNDILAMKEADCAVSVAEGSDAARNVSHIVLLDNNFNSMPKVVYEGRRVINNVQSSASLFLMKTLFNMIMGLIMLCIPAFDTYPFKLEQMILIEVFVIGIPSFALSLQVNDSRLKGKFIQEVLNKSLPSGILMVASGGAAFIYAAIRGIEPNNPIIVTLAVIMLTLAGLISLMYICRPFNKYRTLVFSLCTCIILGVIVYASVCGLDVIKLSSLSPFNAHKFHILLIILVFATDIGLFPLLQKICRKIKIPDITKLVDRKKKKVD